MLVLFEIFYGIENFLIYLRVKLFVYDINI